MLMAISCSYRHSFGTHIDIPTNIHSNIPREHYVAVCICLCIHDDSYGYSYVFYAYSYRFSYGLSYPIIFLKATMHILMDINMDIAISYWGLQWVFL